MDKGFLCEQGYGKCKKNHTESVGTLSCNKRSYEESLGISLRFVLNRQVGILDSLSL